MNLEMIADKLQDDGVGKIGTSIFINQMPVDVASGVILRQPYVGTQIDYELPNYRKTNFSAAVRAKTYAAGSALMALVSESLTFSNTELIGASVKFVRPTTEPVSFPVSDSGCVEFLVIFEAVYVIVA